MLVTAASARDGPAGLQLLTRAAAAHPSIGKARADSACRTAVTEHAATLGIDLQVVRREPQDSHPAAGPWNGPSAG